jgi:uncharacterized protein (DUF58 family)
MFKLPSWKRRTGPPEGAAPAAAPGTAAPAAEAAGAEARAAGRRALDRLLPPDVLRQISPLSLTSRQVMEGTVVGTHRSPYKGFSIEFADHRPYVQGDDTRHLDWRLYGRVERYYVKQYEEETNMRVYLLLDGSRSMAFRGLRTGPTKYEYACRLAAALGFVVVQQGDGLGLVLFDDGLRELIAPRSGLSHLRELVERLVAHDPAHTTDAALALHTAAERIRRRALLVVISDLLDEPQEVIQAIAHFRQRKHDVVVFHLLDDYELRFPYSQTALFEDLETGERLRLTPQSIAAEYREAVSAFVAGYRQACFEYRADYRLVTTDRPPEQVLHEYLSERARR